MARITAAAAQAWFDKTKLTIPESLDVELLDLIETETIARLRAVFDTSTWIDPASTPKLVKVILSKLYAAWYYQRTYSEDQSDTNDYARKLEANAEMLMEGLLTGIIDLEEVPTTDDSTGQAAFYPTDESSAMEATSDDRSLGPSVFSMGQAF